MSQQLINLSSDLKQLRDEGYEIEIRSNHLLIHSIPYVNAKKEIQLGVLVSEITLAGNITSKPGTHVVSFTGDHPCNIDGTEIIQIKHASQTTALAPDITINHSFSNKPAAGYENYWAKMTRYIEIISAPAKSLDEHVDARTFKVIESSEINDVFHYIDTASSRAGISAITQRLALSKVAIIGLGGTGSYILDLIAKTPVKEIHLFDGDRFLQHNAFRSPSAASIEQLLERPRKVAYFKSLYSKLHRNIIAHEVNISESNTSELQGFDFVFICIDDGAVKKIIINSLCTGVTPFIDVGMGVQVVADSLQLLAVCRATTSTQQKREHIDRRISFSENKEANLYAQNIQVADLNALNAALAVIKWKKLLGFYQDLESEHNSTYSTNVNLLTSDELA
jgi:ThiF family